MSRLIENKQLVHIGTEIIILIGLSLYFNNKNKKMVSHIDELSKRLEECEKLILKHEDIIKQLVAMFNSRQSPPEVKQNVFKSKHKVNSKHKQLPIQHPVVQQSKPKITFQKNENTSSDSDLDDEIAEELKELQDNSD